MPALDIEVTDRNLLDRLQSRFPLTPAPYADLGRMLGLAEDDVIRRIADLRRRGIVRQIGPVLDARRLGFRTTLVAMKVDRGLIENAERVIAAHPLVSHGYEREHDLNIWYTLAGRGNDIDKEIDNIGRACGADLCFSLPARKVFKLNAFFGMGDNGQEAATPAGSESVTGPARLSPLDRKVINVLQQDLALTAAPFISIADQASMNVEDFLKVCRSLRDRGVVRRFGAAINHRRAGFAANAMTCWSVAPEAVDGLGHRLAALPQVSHCYERAANPAWRYNVFAMIHGQSRESCHNIAERVSREAGLNDFIQLFSTKEFKKTRVKYTV